MLELDRDQQEALRPHIRLIEAGPGAGKTRTIVERFKARAKVSAAGVALVSFTNAAIDEARKRCPIEVLSYPNFAGTLDAFLHRYIVTPSFIRSKGFSPVYVRSWNEYRYSGFYCAQMRRKVSLDSFCFSSQENGLSSIGICDSDLEDIDESLKNILIDEAKKRLLAFLEKGMISCEYAKRYALTCLRNERRIGCDLKNRFSEIIIDEFQDCSNVEVQIVKLLCDEGIHLVSVADPFQGIYGFRGVNSSVYQEYKKYTLNKYPKSEVVLKTNYRSIGDICNFISKLRVGDNTALMAANKDLQGELSILVGTENEQLQQFKQLIERYGISAENAIVLAYSRRNAKSLAGRTGSGDIDDMSKDAFSRLMRAVFLLQTSNDSRGKANAVQEAIRIIVDSYKWNESVRSSYEDKLTALGMSVSTIRYLMITIISFSFNLSNSYDRDSFSKCVQRSLSDYLPDQALDKSTDKKSVLQRFPKIKERDWGIWKKCVNSSIVRNMIQCSHIHAVRGEEFEAVLLSSKHSRNTTPIWDMKIANALADDEDAEMLRTFYVGASRAKRILAIGVDQKHKDQFLRWVSSLELHNGLDYHIYPYGNRSFQDSLDL